MKIGIMGAGNMGAAFARRLTAADHEVAIAGAGVGASPEGRERGGSTGSGPFPRQELAEDTDLLVLATPYGCVGRTRCVRCATRTARR